MLDFPNPPLTPGQLYVAPNGVTYQWNSTYTAWLPISVASVPGVDFLASMILNGIPNAWTTATGAVVQTGNSGNWYNPTTGRFTPPAGRYFIYAAWDVGYSGQPAHTNIKLRKNGADLPNTTVTVTTGNTGYYSQPFVQGQWDANGTDYFDVQLWLNGYTQNLAAPFWFGAHTVAAPALAAPSSNALQLVGENVLAAPATSIQVNYPGNAKLVEVYFDLVFPSPPTDALMYLRLTQNGAPVTGGGTYVGYWNYATGAGTPTLSAGNSPGTFLQINMSTAMGYQARGNLKLTTPSAFQGVGNWMVRSAGGPVYNWQQGFWSNQGSANGVYFYAPANFDVGSYVRTLAIS